MLLALLACAAPPVDTGREPIEYPSPTITAATAEGDPNEPGWTFEVATDAWTGNGQVYLSADGAYVERHPMYTVGAAYDGSADALRLELGVAADFRDVGEGRMRRVYRLTDAVGRAVYAQTGGFLARQGRARSSSAARRKSVPSSPKRPVNITPIGRPAAFQKRGTLIDGRPAAFASGV